MHHELGISTGECLLYVIVVGVFVGGFFGGVVVGGIARALVPGPDPMSAVTQTVIGAVTFAGAAALLCAVGWVAAVPAGIVIAIVLVLVSRRLRARWRGAQGHLVDGLHEWGRSAFRRREG